MLFNIPELNAEGIGDPQADHQAWRPLNPLNPLHLGDHDPADPEIRPSFCSQALRLPLIPQPAVSVLFEALNHCYSRSID